MRKRLAWAYVGDMTTTRLLSRDSALDLATDHYLAGNVDEQVSDDSSTADLERVLAPWNVRVTRA